MKSAQIIRKPIVKKGKASGECLPFDVFPTAGDDPKEAVITLEIRNDDDRQSWTEDDILVLECEGHLTSTLTVCADFFHGEEEMPRMRLRQKMIPGYAVKCCFELRYLDSSRKFLPMRKGHLKGATFGSPTKLSEVDRVELSVLPGRDFSCLTVRGISLTKTLPDLTVSGAPLVDEFGQWTEEFPGKTHSLRELSDFLRGEYEWSRTHQCYPSEDFDEFGGYRGLCFEARGRFYRHFDGKKWWLVDPLGHAFFSMGLCYGHRTGIYGTVDSFASLFSSLPAEDDPLYGACRTTAEQIPEYVKRNGREDAKERSLYNFARANMMRVFGADWFPAWVSINTARMKQWGFNTISVGVNDYEDERTREFLERARMPYCVTLKDFPKTKRCLFRDFPDVFSAEYEEGCRAFANQLKAYASDPYFIGYFVTNEPEWMFEKSVNVATLTLNSEEETASKKALTEALRENPALTPVELREILIRKYLSVPRKYLQAVAPQTLNLGFRYSSVEEQDFQGEETVDVFSFNCYKKDPSAVFSMAEQKLPLPYLVGEWHIGSLQSGLLSGALQNEETQAKRGEAMAFYMRKALESPLCIGCHYFELNDQPLLGRFDGENQQIGLIDVCNRPYQDCVRVIASQNKNLYRIRAK